MSSEDSDIDNNVMTILQVKNMAWKRSIEWELDIIDLQRLVDNDVFAPQGSKPIQRFRAPGNPQSLRTPVPGLPQSIYDSISLAGLTHRERDCLKVSEEPFLWMEIAIS
ncbi:hypothetical protein M404DRAFT_31098 [Pisolithus tinctorius Marx 270]|uniref:Uncharacterized protein n=1 Tax=Pisolithus tinctorius Marx 270 TaxID=870435 RepID=A0A0C3NCC5_PISTI|nr:hypothetical protein M404DRAFT_31098 [Pisolithus tinctorius Marx 270]